MTSKAASARQNKSRHRAKTPAAKMRDYRARLKAMGLRPKQIWVYDVSRFGFKEECARQSQLARHKADEARLMDFLEGVYDADFASEETCSAATW
jgi:hypothetical protein